MFQSSPSVRRGSERSERSPCYHCILCGLSIRRPRACRESLDSRDQLTRARACVIEGWHGGMSLPPRFYIPLQTFLPKFYDICPLSSINWNSPLSVSTCLYISSNTFGGMVQICAPAANALPTVAASLILAANILVSDLLWQYIFAISRIKPIPSCPLSSKRPTNGDT